MGIDTEAYLSEKRGRLYLQMFTGLTVGVDLCVKALQLLHGTFHYSSLVATMLTMLLLVFVWLGSRVAWWLMVMCLSLAILFCCVVALSGEVVLGLCMVMPLATLMWLFVHPSTRDFVLSQSTSIA